MTFKKPSDRNGSVGELTQGPLDEIFGQRNVFGVEEDSSGMNVASESVKQYLKSVRHEAENTPAIFYKQRDEANMRTLSASSKESDILQADEDSVYLRAWSQSLITHFLLLKKESQIHTIQDTAFENKACSTSVRSDLPSTAPQWRQHVLNNPPPEFVSFYEKFDHILIIKLIIYFTKWLSKSINEDFSLWIFYVFVRLDNALSAEEEAILRDFAKKAIKIKCNNEELDSTTSYTLDFIITIVSLYYGQKDLPLS